MNFVFVFWAVGNWGSVDGVEMGDEYTVMI